MPRLLVVNCLFTLLAIITGVAGLTGAGCGDDAGPDPATDGGALADAGPTDAAADPDAAALPWTPESLCLAISERICGGLQSCECRFDVRPYDAATCVAARAAECTAGVTGELGPALADGDLVFFDSGITGCLAGLDAQATACTLGDRGPLPTACEILAVAPVGLTEACGVEGPAPCADGAGRCAAGEVEGAPWICTALPGATEPCPDFRCATGLSCRFDEDGPVCVPLGADGDDCATDEECGPGLTCPPVRLCVPPGGFDANCDDNRDCGPELACVFGGCAPASPLGDGCENPEACGNDQSCGRAPETRTCTDPDGEGDPCRFDTCAAGLICGSLSGVCEVAPGEDESCLDGNACAPGLTCDFNTGTCEVPPGDGEPCFDFGDRRCAEGFGCRELDSTCQPAAIATVGEPCLLTGNDYLCAPGLGCDFTSEGSFCAARGDVGVPCNTDRTCLPTTWCGPEQVCADRLDEGTACSVGTECRIGSECVPLPGGFTCAPIPGRDEPCVSACDPGLACKGPGGECVAELCVIP